MHRTRRARWWSTFTLLVLILSAWSIATPLFAAPDEPSHVIRAVAAAHGEFSVKSARLSRTALAALQRRGTLGNLRGAETIRGATRELIPEIYASGYNVGCFAFYRDRTAACESFTGPTTLANVYTTSGREPPAYFAAVGLVSWVTSPGAETVYVMRLLSALLCAALLASAFVTTELFRRPAVAALGVVLAFTPMALFLGSVVNPSGIEIAAAITAWICGVALVWRTDGEIDRRLVARLAIAASVLALARPLGPLWVAFVGASMLAVARRGTVRRLLRVPTVRYAAELVACFAAFQGIWSVAAGTLNAGLNNNGGAVGPYDLLLRDSIGGTYPRFQQMVGIFGWLDTTSPSVTYVIWIVALGLLAVLAVLLASRRINMTLASLAALVIVIPVAFEAPDLHTSGFYWQGRYTLPLAVGVPILAGLTVASSGELSTIPRRRRVLYLLGGALLVAQAAAFVQTLRRYMVGYEGKLLFFVGPAWQPPLPALLLIVVFVAAYAALLVQLTGSRRVGADRPAVCEPDGTE